MDAVQHACMRNMAPREDTHLGTGSLLMAHVALPMEGALSHVAEAREAWY